MVDCILVMLWVSKAPILLERGQVGNGGRGGPPLTVGLMEEDVGGFGRTSERKSRDGGVVVGRRWF